MRFARNFFLLLVVLTLGLLAYKFLYQTWQQNVILKQMINRLEADSRIAQVLVTGVNYSEKDKKTYTTIKFLEFDVEGQPLPPQYFAFSGNIIQFQSLVIRFDDTKVRTGHPFKGKSVYLFWKVFMLDGQDTQEYEITNINSIPSGYKIQNNDNPFEQKLWQNFWDYALDPQKAKQKGIKNAQIEAPGTMFIPGHIYTIKIEHDGGLRIDADVLPEILKGERM